LYHFKEGGKGKRRVASGGPSKVQQSFNQNKILVVEDNDDSREMLVTLLSLERYKVVGAQDGVEGLALARKELPHLIITDMHMPNLDGLQLIKMLRAEAQFSSVPILALTAYTDGAALQAIDAGADKALLKPVNYELLITTIKHLLQAD
jgi:CheY-like chemotaxis protein